MIRERVAARSWIDDLADGFSAWLASQSPEVQAQEQRWWDAISEGLPAWLVDQPNELEQFGWPERIDRFIQEARR